MNSVLMNMCGLLDMWIVGLMGRGTHAFAAGGPGSQLSINPLIHKSISAFPWI